MTAPPPAAIPLLEVRDLAVSFENSADPSVRVQAVAGVSMTIWPRQTLAVVGESGCGKSVTALSLVRLVPDIGLADVFVCGSRSFTERVLDSLRTLGIKASQIHAERFGT